MDDSINVLRLRSKTIVKDKLKKPELIPSTDLNKNKENLTSNLTTFLSINGAASVNNNVNSSAAIIELGNHSYRGNASSLVEYEVSDHEFFDQNHLNHPSNINEDVSINSVSDDVDDEEDFIDYKALENDIVDEMNRLA